MHGGNNKNHLLCYDCGFDRNVDVLVRTNQGFWRTVCLNCATKPEYNEWYWRCMVNNCVCPIIAENHWHCYAHHQLYVDYWTQLD
jgi:hypothetical protein